MCCSLLMLIHRKPGRHANYHQIMNTHKKSIKKYGNKRPNFGGREEGLVGWENIPSLNDFDFGSFSRQ
jgi:hypothetical protein